MVDQAADTLQRSIDGEDVDAAAIASAKFVVEQTVGKAGQTRTIEGHIDHAHQHTIDVNEGYLLAMKSLAAVASQSRGSVFPGQRKAPPAIRHLRRGPYVLTKETLR